MCDNNPTIRYLNMSAGQKAPMRTLSTLLDTSIPKSLKIKGGEAASVQPLLPRKETF